jgi:hypothetical protein
MARQRRHIRRSKYGREFIAGGKIRKGVAVLKSLVIVFVGAFLILALTSIGIKIINFFGIDEFYYFILIIFVFYLVYRFVDWLEDKL